MTLKDFIKILQNYTTGLLDREGWSLAFELIEKQENFIVLKLKNRYVEILQSFKNYTDASELMIEIPSFTKIYQTKDEMAKTIAGQTVNKGADPYIVYEYKIMLLEEVGQLLAKNKIFVDVNKLAQANNYSYIHSVHIKDFFSLKNINLKDIKGTKEVYFLGENGDGKSLILMAMHLSFNGNFTRTKTNFEFTGKIQEMIRVNEKLKLSAKDTDGTVYKLSSKFEKATDSTIENKMYFLNNFYAYGAQRGRYTKDFPEKYGFMSLYDGETQLYSPEQLLGQIYLLELEKRLDGRNMNPEVKNLPEWVPLNTIQGFFQELLEKNVEIEVTASAITFKEKGYKLYFNQLSEGYKNIMVWTADLIYRLQQDQPNIYKLEDFKGVVLLDEIELHLHPLWQERLVGQLRSFFPKIQFIFTTHSPTIIQGASDEAIIYRVYRDAATGETKVSEPYYKKDLDHLMFNTLVTSPLFGLENARMSKDAGLPDTSDTYLQNRINKRIAEELERQKQDGKEFITDQEIDSIIDNLLSGEFNK